MNYDPPEVTTPVEGEPDEEIEIVRLDEEIEIVPLDEASLEDYPDVIDGVIQLDAFGAPIVLKPTPVRDGVKDTKNR